MEDTHALDIHRHPTNKEEMSTDELLKITFSLIQQVHINSKLFNKIPCMDTFVLCYITELISKQHIVLLRFHKKDSCNMFPFFFTHRVGFSFLSSSNIHCFPKEVGDSFCSFLFPSYRGNQF